MSKPFLKGNIPWNKNLKGIHLSSQTEYKKGLIPWNKGKKGVMPIPWNRGLKGIHLAPQTEFKKGSSGFTGKHSEESKRKMSESKKGRPAWNKGKPAPWAKGNKHCLGKSAWNKGLKGYRAGEKNNRWKGGITPINEKIRKSDQYKEWRIAVLKRDNYSCVNCGVRQTRKLPLVADHIKPFALFPELRFEIGNGRSLCRKCDAKIGWKWDRHKSAEENLKRCLEDQ